MVVIDNESLVDGKYAIGDLVDLVALRDTFEKFTLATGFTIGFLDHPGMNLLITTGWRDICTKFHRCCPVALDICAKSNFHLLDRLKTPGQLAIEACGNGLVDCATPIIIKGKHIASLATGQLLIEKPDHERFRAQAGKYGFDEAEYMKALEEIPIFSEEKVKSATTFLGSLANLISELGYTNLVKKDETERLEKEIADRKRAEEMLNASIKEKETLLRELYHRTKNNMQVISSMLGLRASLDDSERVKTVFTDMTAKIKAMSLVHQKLYQSKDLSSINLKEFIGELVRMFVQIYGKGTKIKLDEEIDNIGALIDTAIPLGLIISELMANSFKHAFADGRAGKIFINLKKSPDGVIHMRFSDNGPGLAEGFDTNAQKGMGLKSLVALAEHQLQGNIDYKNDGGLVCTIRFSDNLYKPRV